MNTIQSNGQPNHDDQFRIDHPESRKLNYGYRINYRVCWWEPFTPDQLTFNQRDCTLAFKVNVRIVETKEQVNQLMRELASQETRFVVQKVIEKCNVLTK